MEEQQTATGAYCLISVIITGQYHDSPLVGNLRLYKTSNIRSEALHALSPFSPVPWHPSHSLLLLEHPATSSQLSVMWPQRPRITITTNRLTKHAPTGATALWCFHFPSLQKRQAAIKEAN